MIIIAQKYKGFGTRLIRARKSYEFPPLRKDPRIVNKFSGTYTKELVKVLASDFGLGGLFAEEVLQRSNIDKNKKIISKEESDRLIKAINSLFVPEQKIYIYKKDSVVAVLPLSLHDTQLSCLITDNWSSYFEENCLPKASAQKAKKQNKLEQLEQIQQQQIAKINGLTLAIKENTDKAHLIYTYYSELAHLMKNKVGKIDSKEQSIIITLEDKK